MTFALVSVLSKVVKPKPGCYMCLINKRTFQTLKNGTNTLLKKEKRPLLIRPIPVQIKYRYLQVTPPRKALPPIIVLLLRPLAKILTIISGQIVRKWWRGLSPAEKAAIKDMLRRRSGSLFLSFFVLTLMLMAYYRSHIVESPITKRKQFIMFTDEVMDEIARFGWQEQMDTFKREIVPPGHPFHQRTLRVCNALLLANRDMPEVRKKQWKLAVIDRPDFVNAFCFPSGEICIFTGVLNVCTNDDQLAFVLSHEIAHNILNHAAETMSKMFVIDALLIIPSFICWMILSNAWAFMSEWLTQSLTKIFIGLAFSRSLEIEADHIGLLLAARSCFDVREAAALWNKMSKINSYSERVEWLSTHPSDETRIKELHNRLPEALKLQDESNCPKFKTRRLSFF